MRLPPVYVNTLKLNIIAIMEKNLYQPYPQGRVGGNRAVALEVGEDILGFVFESNHSPQCLHFFAVERMVSPQYGHLLNESELEVFVAV